MRAFLATVLSVIAVGVLLIAYGLLAPRTSAASPGMSVVYDAQTGTYQLVQPASAQHMVVPNPAAYGYQAVPVGYNTPAPYSAPATFTPAVYSQPVVYREPQPAPVVRTARAASAPQRSVARVEERSGRNWKKTALVIGGSTAAGAGIGAAIGGKKGALIGAAIGGGASTLYETTK